MGLILAGWTRKARLGPLPDRPTSMIVRWPPPPAMGSWFEAFLIGTDEEHLMAVGEAALDEVSRLDRLLSRHDRASEVSRIHREAAGRPVRVGPELFALPPRLPGTGRAGPAAPSTPAPGRASHSIGPSGSMRRPGR